MIVNWKNRENNNELLYFVSIQTIYCVLLTLESSLSSGHMLFRRQHFRSYWNYNIEQFAARAETIRTAIQPFQSVTEDILFGQ